MQLKSSLRVAAPLDHQKESLKAGLAAEIAEEEHVFDLMVQVCVDAAKQVCYQRLFARGGGLAFPKGGGAFGRVSCCCCRCSPPPALQMSKNPVAQCHVLPRCPSVRAAVIEIPLSRRSLTSLDCCFTSCCACVCVCVLCARVRVLSWCAPANQPVEDASVLWDESVSPYIKLGEVRVPRQTLDKQTGMSTAFAGKLENTKQLFFGIG